MNIETSCIEKQVIMFCAQVGVDSLLVQGAGGNVSWKDGGILWVKASGMWLADAGLKEIFVPINFKPLQIALSKRDFAVIPEVTNNSNLKPSIETLLHALMPHRVVVHLHSVEILAYLVQVDAKKKIKQLVGGAVKWVYVDYFKPGVDLAKAVYEELVNFSDIDVVFMANHGVVIGGRDVNDVALKMYELIAMFKTEPLCTKNLGKQIISDPKLLALGYSPCDDIEINQLAIDDILISRLYKEWALYPDHVVFLGAEAVIIATNSYDSASFDYILRTNPPFIFLIGRGVFERSNATRAQKSQLRCYYDVISRQPSSNELIALSEKQVFEVLNWDAEKYRQEISANII